MTLKRFLPGNLTAYWNGHYYSPVVDRRQAQADQERLWPREPASHPEIDSALPRQLALLATFPRWLEGFDHPRDPDPSHPSRYHWANEAFGWLDARALFVLLRMAPPARLVEVGCGHSTKLICDLKRRFLAGRPELTCIDPFPPPFLDGLPIDALHRSRVQDLPLHPFTRLCAGDVLFIDSSHVAKTGSDVNHLFFEVLPRLKPGVRVHLHDIFLPDEYPRAWVIDENRSWNEQYLLRAFLSFNRCYAVDFACHYLWRNQRTALAAALSLPESEVFGGSSFWMQRCR